MSLIAIATAIIGIYIMLALIASNITEAISAILDKRGSTLFLGIQSLVGETTKLGAVVADQDDAVIPTLAKALYQNPLVLSLAGTPNGTDKVFHRDPQPSYIPSRTFTLALLDEIRQRQTTGAGGALMSLPDLVSTPDALFKDIIARISGLPDGHLKQMMTLAVQNADQSYDGFLKSIDTMFEACMQRVSGWYKRWSQVIVAIFALLLVVLLNVDTIALAQELATNATELQTLSATSQQLKQDIGLDDLVKVLSTVPLGWTSVDCSMAGHPKKDCNAAWLPSTDHGPAWILSKVCGLIISWFAVMLGAPFWFDLLKRFVPIRMTGDVPTGNNTSTKTPGDAQEPLG